MQHDVWPIGHVSAVISSEENIEMATFAPNFLEHDSLHFMGHIIKSTSWQGAWAIFETNWMNTRHLVPHSELLIRGMKSLPSNITSVISINDTIVSFCVLNRTLIIIKIRHFNLSLESDCCYLVNRLISCRRGKRKYQVINKAGIKDGEFFITGIINFMCPCNPVKINFTSEALLEDFPE